ncbi:MAG: hypothetical protein FWC47_13310 [Oscillospiraceae bacterium]|nr:hypothetical protein [Oscillospiraceae bacterium]
MFAIKAIYDGDSFRLEKPIPVKEDYEVIITFVEPIKKDQSGIMELFNTWNDEDAEFICGLMEERNNFFDGRENS